MLRRFIELLKICKIYLVLFLFFFLFTSSNLSAGEDLRQQLEELHERFDEYQQELEETGEEYQQAQQKLEDAREQEDSILSLLDRYEQQINNTRRRLRNLRRREEEARSRLEEAEEEMEELEELLEEREELLLERLRGIYKQGELNRVELVLGSESLDELVVRSRYFREVINHDREIIETYQETREELKELQEERSEILQERQQLRRSARQTLSDLEETRKRRREALDDLRDRKEFYEQRARELENQQQRLRDVVLELQSEKEATEARLERITHRFGSRRGELHWPVNSREIHRPFGEVEENGFTVNNDGIDIKVEEEAPVEAVAPGEVAFARPYRGMGKVVILQHGDGYATLYGSLVQLAVERGDEVKEGALIGRAGQTSGLDVPRLYFQIFRGRDILNPEEWLE